MSIRCMMDGMQLLIIWCAAFICGNNEVSSCEVEINVRRGTTKYVSPGQSLTIKCPIKHCGTISNVIWCKFSDTNHCGNISKTENIEIREEKKGTKLVSYLKFKQVSINDEGLYQCAFGHSVSHVTNISVSDQNKGVENPENSLDTHDDDDDDDDDSSWLRYFIICFSIGLSITAVIVFTLICFYGWKETWTCNNKNQEEISTHIPELSRNFSPTLRTQFTLRNDIYSSSTGEGTTSMSPVLNHSGNRQTASNTANTQASSSALYAIINNQQCGAQPRNFTCKNDEKTNYAVINVP